MEELKRPKKQEAEKLSEELLEEWYTEKEGEVLPERPEEPEEGPEEKREIVSKPLPSQQEPENLEIKEREEGKRAVVKNKIKYLLALGEEKGLKKAIEEAERENDPLLIDLFHDILIKEGMYKKFFKK